MCCAKIPDFYSREIQYARHCEGAGAAVPDGADAVVQIENTQQLPDQTDGEKRIKINKVSCCTLPLVFNSMMPACLDVAANAPARLSVSSSIDLHWVATSIVESAL